MGRIAVLGSYRQIYDLSVLGAGAEVSVGGEGAMHGGHVLLRFSRGESSAGLIVDEVALLGSYELHWRGLRTGIGGGVSLPKIQRATGNDIHGHAMELFGRVGYDFGERTGPYLLGQFSLQGQHVWGPTIFIGYRF